MPYVFDTAQVLRGLLATADLLPSARNGARKCIDYLFSRLKLGQNGFDIDSIWLERFSDAIPLSSHLYALPPLYGAADVLQHAQLKQAVENCANYYIGLEECLQLTALTHFLAYELEALIDLGKISLARQVLDKLREEQKTDGSVRALEGVNWVCAPGLAQLAVCWYKIGDKHPADQAVGWLERHQMPSGGFLGSYGRGATYFPDSELSWAVKFYLDAKFLQQRS
jgi:malonyl-CoA O-methyltransferase